MAELARDIGENEVTVRAWKRRGSIPASKHVAVVEAARKRDLNLDYERLARACAKPVEGDAERAA